MELTRHKFGEVSEFDRMRAIVMGAAAIQYLGGVAKRGIAGMRGYLSHFGLPPIPPKQVIDFLERKEAYGNDDQTQRFVAMVAKWQGAHHPS